MQLIKIPRLESLNNLCIIVKFLGEIVENKSIFYQYVFVFLSSKTKH